MSRRYLIWSQEHGAWWGPAKHGYSRSIFSAGRYSLEEATEIVNEANAHLPHGEFNEIIFPDPMS